MKADPEADQRERGAQSLRYPPTFPLLSLNIPQISLRYPLDVSFLSHIFLRYPPTFLHFPRYLSYIPLISPRYLPIFLQYFIQQRMVPRPPPSRLAASLRPAVRTAVPPQLPHPPQTNASAIVSVTHINQLLFNTSINFYLTYRIVSYQIFPGIVWATVPLHYKHTMLLLKDQNH